jgi:holo-[acyl-carrier protein] synthase
VSSGKPSPGLGVGLDLLEIARLERALERRPRLAMRLFTDAERAYAASRARPGQHLAARFCAKEAVAKALGLEAWSFRDIEVVSTGGAPSVALHGSVAQRAAELGVRVSISLTHTGSEAAAVAIIAPV